MALDRQSGSVEGIAQGLHNLGYVAQHQGDIGLAAARFAESLGRFQGLGQKEGVAQCLAGLAGVATARGEAEQAARLFGADAALRDEVGAAPQTADRQEHDRNVVAVRAALGDKAFAAAWEVGRALTLEQAVAEALTVAAEAGAGAGA